MSSSSGTGGEPGFQNRKWLSGSSDPRRSRGPFLESPLPDRQRRVPAPSPRDRPAHSRGGRALAHRADLDRSHVLFSVIGTARTKLWNRSSPSARARNRVAPSARDPVSPAATTKGMAVKAGRRRDTFRRAAFHPCREVSDPSPSTGARRRSPHARDRRPGRHVVTAGRLNDFDDRGAEPGLGRRQRERPGTADVATWGTPRVDEGRDIGGGRRRRPGAGTCGRQCEQPRQGHRHEKKHVAIPGPQ